MQTEFNLYAWNINNIMDGDSDPLQFLSTVLTSLFICRFSKEPAGTQVKLVSEEH